MIALIEPGLVPYGQALTLQLDLRERLRARGEGDPVGYVVCLEHPPVVTLGKRGELDALVAPELLARQGVEVFKIDRGGEATFHEPGQLVVYPILHLKALELGVVDLIHTMAALLAEAIAPHGAIARYDREYPGLWTEEETPRKIASVGMRVSGGVTTHGVAINLINDMTGFGWIVPCGMPTAPLCRLLDLATPAPEDPRALFDDVRRAFLDGLADYLGHPFEPMELELPPRERWQAPLSLDAARR